MSEDPSLTFLPEIERSIDGIYRTLDFLVRTEQYDTGLRLAQSIYPYWESREYLSEGIDWLLKFTSLPPHKYDQTALPGLYHMLGNLLRHQSNYTHATGYYQHGLAALDVRTNIALHTSILSGLGEAAFRQGDYASATSFYQTHLTVGRQANDGRRVADSMNALGRLATVKGDIAVALEYHDYGHHLCNQNHYQTGRAWCLNALGELERSRGAKRKAAGYFRESAAIFESLGNTGPQMLVLQNLALVTLANRPIEAEQLLNRLLAFWARGPAKHGMAVCLVGLGTVETLKGSHRRAATQLCIATHLLNRSGARLELGDGMDYDAALTRVQKHIKQKPYDTLFQQLGGLTTDELIMTASQLNATSQPSTPLTARETAILSLAAQGLTDKQIAITLIISPHTVNAHLKSIYQKLAVNNRMTAVSLARQRRLI
jgi:non-specific serine/threonine protein kinase